MEQITIESKVWKPKKNNPAQTYLNIKATDGRYFGVWDTSVAMMIDKYPEGTTFSAHTTQNKGYWNITALGNATSPDSTPAPAPNHGGNNTPPPVDKRQESIESQNALTNLTLLATSECTPKKERDEIRAEILPILRSRVSNGISHNNGGNPSLPQESARTPEAVSSEAPVSDDSEITEAGKLFQQLPAEAQYNALKSLAREMSGDNDAKMIKALEIIDSHQEKGTGYNLYMLWKKEQKKRKDEEPIPF